jgi:hypothetical protein
MLIFASVMKLAKLSLIYGFGREGKLGNNVLCVVEVAVKRVIFGRNVDTVIAADAEPIVLNVKAVDLQGRAIYDVILAVIMAANHKATFRIMGKGGLAQVLKFPASGH